jgi:hypothetical protein
MASDFAGIPTVDEAFPLGTLYSGTLGQQRFSQSLPYQTYILPLNIPTQPRQTCIASLASTERRILQHMALVSLGRAPLRHGLDIQSLLNVVFGRCGLP